MNANGWVSDRVLSRATYYALYLRACGYSGDEAAVLVMERYPNVRIPYPLRKRPEEARGESR